MDAAALDRAIEGILGQGLRYSAWRVALEKQLSFQGQVWHPGLENVIKKKEFEKFKEEILRLRLEDRIAHPSRNKSNSLNSILKRLKGKPWVEGLPGEKAQRLQERRLISKDAKSRSLGNYVKKWEREDTHLASQAAAIVSDGSSITDADGHQSTTTIIAAATRKGSFQGATEPELETDSPPTQDIDMTNTNTLPSTSNNFPEPLTSNTIIPIYSDPCWSTHDDSTLSPTRQHAVSFTDATSPASFYQSRDAESLEPTSAFSHGLAISSFDEFRCVEDDIPYCSVDYSQGSQLHEIGPDIFEFFDTYPLSEENSEIPGTASKCASPSPSRTTFTDKNMADAIATEKGFASKAGATPHNTSVLPAMQQVSSQDGSVVSASSPRHVSNARKRRRRNTFGVPPDVSEPSAIASEFPTTNVPPDEDTTMTDYNDNLLSPKALDMNVPWVQQPPPSRPLPKAPTALQTAHAFTQSQLKLEEELQKARSDLQSLVERHRVELEVLSKKHEAAEAEILELREQVRRLQLSKKRSSQEYDIREQISEQIIKEAGLRKKSVSGISINATGEEGEHNMKTFRRFPSSKHARPLSLSLRPAAATTGTPIAQIISPTSSESPAIPRLPLPIVTGRSSRSGSADSLAPRPAAIGKETSTAQRNRPVSSGNTTLALNPVTPINQRNSTDSMDILEALEFIPTCRSNRSGSADSLAATSISNITSEEASPIKHLMRKISDGFMRKPNREERGSQVPPVPTLPMSVTTAPVFRQLSEAHKDGDKRLTYDSGYASSNFETSSRVSIADIQ